MTRMPGAHGKSVFPAFIMYMDHGKMPLDKTWKKWLNGEPKRGEPLPWQKV